MSAEIDYSLAANAVHIWHASLTVPAILEKQFIGTLSRDEMARAERFHFPDHRARFIAARGILRALLARYQGIAPAAVDFHYHERGKPFVEDDSLRFNISHSHTMGVFAFTRHAELGVDIEKIEYQFNDSVAERYFHSQEYALLTGENAVDRAKAFYRIWARKEAVIKAIGDGMHFPLNSFSTAEDQLELCLHNEATQWICQDIAIDENYQAAITRQDQLGVLSHFEW